MPKGDSNNEIKIQTDEDLDDSVVAEENLADQVKGLREKLKGCEKARQELFTDLQRAKADFINLRKRDEEEKSNFIRLSNESFIREILPVLDSMEMAMRLEEKSQGVKQINSQLLSILARLGVKELNPIGEVFDPSLSEAVGTVETEEKDDHRVLEVLQKGFEFQGKVIRPAKVKIGEFKGD